MSVLYQYLIPSHQPLIDRGLEKWGKPSSSWPPSDLRLIHEKASATNTSTSPINNHVVEEEATQALPEQCARIHRKVAALLRRRPETERLKEVQRQTRISLGVIGEALEKYGLDELSFSYNGGKDCLVLLILYLAALHLHSVGETANDAVTTSQPPPNPQCRNPLPATLRSVYIVTPNPFPAVTSFVYRSAQQYHLSLDQYHKPMKEAFASYLHDHSDVKAIFVGTRRTDPHGGQLTHFDPTTDDWPTFMRIHPVIDWHYADIWTFIRELGVDYCELYDQGYTSLGGTNDTHPNPALAIDGQGASSEGGEVVNGDRKDVKYRPAYELTEDNEERLGRDGLRKTASV